MDIKTFKEVFDPIIKDYIDIKINQSKSLLSDPKLNSYLDYIKDFLFSWWKRIRPYCMWLMYRWFGWKSDQDSMYYSIVFELLHSMALIHDDIIDQADKRHNIPSMHKYITSILWDTKNHIWESQAMLIWDLIFSRVYELSNKTHNFPIEYLVEARQNLQNMIEEVILWQMIDVEMMSWEVAPYQLIEKKCYYKTASYTFIRPMLSWAILSWADKNSKNLIYDLWKYLWLAFQLRDDMMDITFWDETKSPFSDIQEWQQTYFTNYIFNNWTQQQKEMLHNTMWNKLNNQQISDLQNIFQQSWALDYWKSLLIDYSQKAKIVLDQISFKDNIARDWITALIQKISKI